MKLQPIVSYQGGKQRLAPTIVKYLLKEGGDYYYDLCCGSGAITLELVNRGIPPSNITMIDSGPWGVVWSLIGMGLFPLKTLELYIKDIPQDRSKIKNYMEKLSKRDARIDQAITFLLLQAASFGSKPIWVSKDNKWANTSFRSYWQPTAKSNRRSPVNPMMPMPETLLKRAVLVCEKMKGVKAYQNTLCEKIRDCSFRNKNTVVYVDPPYRDRTTYEQPFDAVAWWRRQCTKDKTGLSLEKILNVKATFISEGYKASENAILLAGSSERKKGGVSGNKKVNPNEEWLNVF